MKKMLICILLVIMLITLCGCGEKPASVENKMLSAKVRYFDGSCETIPIQSYSYLSGGATCRIVTSYGDVYYFGSNNIVIVNEVIDE